VTRGRNEWRRRHKIEREQVARKMSQLCQESPNGWHRVAVEKRLSLTEEPFLVGTCEHCGAPCQADRVVGAKWYALGVQWDDHPLYLIEELP
jgi:hypothetical protein